MAAVALVAVGRLSRWRPHWLAAPALASLIWLLAVGPASAAAAVGEGVAATGRVPARSAARHPGRLAHPAAAVAGAGAWLPRQLPLALLAATGEAGLVLWLGMVAARARLALAARPGGAGAPPSVRGRARGRAHRHS